MDGVQASIAAKSKQMYESGTAHRMRRGKILPHSHALRRIRMNGAHVIGNSLRW